MKQAVQTLLAYNGKDEDEVEDEVEVEVEVEDNLPMTLEDALSNSLREVFEFEQSQAVAEAYRSFFKYAKKDELCLVHVDTQFEINNKDAKDLYVVSPIETYEDTIRFIWDQISGNPKIETSNPINMRETLISDSGPQKTVGWFNMKEGEESFIFTDSVLCASFTASVFEQAGVYNPTVPRLNMLGDVLRVPGAEEDVVRGWAQKVANKTKRPVSGVLNNRLVSFKPQQNFK